MSFGTAGCKTRLLSSVLQPHRVEIIPASFPSSQVGLSDIKLQMIKIVLESATGTKALKLKTKSVLPVSSSNFFACLWAHAGSMEGLASVAGVSLKNLSWIALSAGPRKSPGAGAPVPTSHPPMKS